VWTKVSGSVIGAEYGPRRDPGRLQTPA
jgi:hypothetical protein